RLIAWLRLRVAADFPLASLRLAWAGLHAIEIEQRQALADRVLGVSDGGSDQRFELGLAAQDSAEPEALQCRVHDTVLGSRVWQQVDDLGRAGPLDEVYRFDAEAGSLCFGDGIQGRVPSTGSRIVAAGLRVGGGARGNLPAGTLSKLASVSDLLSG
ncbi:putative baseplate assembly protein, partial [Paucibacter sp. XJ19-41]|nr:putative baseplate assembly protein [Paucibacter sp. XJ19-41]